MSTRLRRTEEQRALLPPRSDGRPGASRGDDLLPSLDNIYAEKKESFLRRYGKKIAGGIACAFVVSVFMNLKYVHLVVLWACEIVIMIFGRPHGAEKLDKLEEKTVHVMKKGRELLHPRPEGGAVPKPAVPLALALGNVPPVKKLKEEAHVVREVAGTAKALEKGGVKIAAAIKDAGSKAKEAVGGGVAAIAEARRKKKEAQEKAEHDRLMVRARAAGLKADESWSNAKLEAEIGQAELIAWRKRFNAMCPNPKCRRPMKISDRMKRERFRCPKCQGIFSGATARALGTPPMGQPRRSLFGGLFH